MLEAPELLRSRDPLRRTCCDSSSLPRDDLPAVGPLYCQLAVVIFPLAHEPQHLKRRLSWLKKTNLKRRTDERQNTQRNTQQRSDSAHTHTQPTQLALLELEHRL